MFQLYTRDRCAQCMMTKKLLQAMNIDYTEINTSKHPEILDDLRKMNLPFKSMPVLLKDEEVVSAGFMPDKIKRLKAI